MYRLLPARPRQFVNAIGCCHLDRSQSRMPAAGSDWSRVGYIISRKRLNILFAIVTNGRLGDTLLSLVKSCSFI